MPKKNKKTPLKKVELLEMCNGMFFIGESFETIQANFQKEKLKDAKEKQ